MITRLCDRCGQPIESESVRYVAKIQVFAAYDPLELTFDDLNKDYKDEIKRILDQCHDLSEEELMRDVYIEFSFDLCYPCQRAYIKAPLPSI